MNDIGFPLTSLHLEFICQATAPVNLGGWHSGANLRGALTNIMKRSACSCPPGQPDPQHCPVCALIVANEHPGQERRGYALVPPNMPGEVIRAGEQFSFGVSLFGDAQQQLLFFLLASIEAGEQGVGLGRERGLGRFALHEVWAVNPLGDERDCIRAAGEARVREPRLMLTHAYVQALADQILQHGWPGEDEMCRLELRFLTPLRLIEDEHRLKAPDFGLIFEHLLKRIDQLARQYCGAERRPMDEILALQAQANTVRLVNVNTRWLDVAGGSARLGRKVEQGGLVGNAVYSASRASWQALLPWLLWGKATQLGKMVVKGNGLFDLKLL
jgi:hypothetical protein